MCCLLQLDLQKAPAAEMKTPCDSDRDADLFRPAGYFIRRIGRGRAHMIKGHDSDGFSTCTGLTLANLYGRQRMCT